MKQQPALWKDANVIVTGASSGIGRAVATQLLAEGAHVVAMARRAELLQSLEGALACPVDLSDTAAIQGAVDQTLANLSKTPHGQTVDALLYFAGVATVTPPEQLTDTEYERVMGANIRGARTLCTAVQPALADDARLALCSSGITLLPEVYGFEFYRLSKIYLETYAEWLRQQLQPEQSVTTVLPGFVDTEIWRKEYGVRGEKMIGRLGRLASFSAEECARHCLQDTAERKPLSYPTPDVRIIKELLRSEKVGEVASGVASLFWKQLHRGTKK
ncbi:MAG: hypothetical protein ACD_41C00127G0004 [uncultured bacterium]|nr:MAG: hypothetical protein ACD_41C00127G0004 [uncultured bacterium]